MAWYKGMIRWNRPRYKQGDKEMVVLYFAPEQKHPDSFQSPAANSPAWRGLTKKEWDGLWDEAGKKRILDEYSGDYGPDTQKQCRKKYLSNSLRYSKEKIQIVEKTFWENWKKPTEIKLIVSNSVARSGYPSSDMQRQLKENSTLLLRLPDDLDRVEIAASNFIKTVILE